MIQDIEKTKETHDKLREIKERFERGYTLSLYGSKELLYKQMLDDIHSLLILFDARKRAIDNRIAELENVQVPYDELIRIDELKNLLKWFG